MITPEEIRLRAAKLFEPAISAWIAGDETFFPCRLRGANLRVTSSTNQSQLIEQVERLRQESKASRGFGYSVRYAEVRKRLHGLNHYPSSIEIETLADLLKLIGRQAEFRRLEGCVERLRSRLPQLEAWLGRGWKKLLPVLQEVEDLVEVTQYMLLHPRPGCYLRELPLGVSSKLIETHKGLLTEWWNQVLPEAAIDFGAIHHFERRFGFCYPRQHLLVRLLDSRLLTELHFPCSELSLPTEELDRLPIEDCNVVVVENKINLLTLPSLPRTIALGGMGSNLAEYQCIGWLHKCPLFYWGDIDEAGLMILAQFRFAFPHLRSCLMEIDTLRQFSELAAPGLQARQSQEPPQLDALELEALRVCRTQQLRLEQERLPQHHVNRVLQQLISCRANL